MWTPFDDDQARDVGIPYSWTTTLEKSWNENNNQMKMRTSTNLIWVKHDETTSAIWTVGSTVLSHWNWHLGLSCSRVSAAWLYTYAIRLVYHHVIYIYMYISTVCVGMVYYMYMYIYIYTPSVSVMLLHVIIFFAHGPPTKKCFKRMPQASLLRILWFAARAIGPEYTRSNRPNATVRYNHIESILNPPQFHPIRSNYIHGSIHPKFWSFQILHHL